MECGLGFIQKGMYVPYCGPDSNCCFNSFYRFCHRKKEPGTGLGRYRSGKINTIACKEYFNVEQVRQVH
jgi:hypothetical protein